MRIFIIVFSLLVGILAVSAGIILGKDFLTERIAVYEFKQDVNELHLIAQRENQVNTCFTASSINSVTNGLNGYQIRFTSDTDYVIEPVCLYPPNEPNAPIKRGTLFGGVKRLYGAGVHFTPRSVADSWTILQYKNDLFSVGLFSGNIVAKWNISNPESIGGDNPAVGNCSDWGFSCCSLNNEIGTGTQAPTLDCPKTCYQQCQSKPEIVFFNSVPTMNGATRTLNLSGNSNLVQFGYQIKDDAHIVTKVTIDYGDGKQEQTSNLQVDNLIHKYTCAQSHCVFKTTITIADANNIGLSVASNNSIKVIVDK